MTLPLTATHSAAHNFRPKVALAMKDEHLRDALFSARLRGRLEAVADCDFNLLIRDFQSVPDAVLSGLDVLLTGWHAPEINDTALHRMPHLRLIAHAGGSVKEHVSSACWERNILVTTAAMANAIPVAELALAQILFAGKSVLAGAHLYQVRQARIDRELEFPRTGNYEKTVGIVGASTIGRLVIERLRMFDLDVLVYDPTVSAADIDAMGARKVSLQELLRDSEIVSLHAPVLPTTRGMIGRLQLSAMRTGATLINTARGELIDHDALRDELVSGRISALLDVTVPEPLPPGDPLYSLPNVLLTPHLAGSAGTELYRLADFAIREVEQFAAGSPPLYPVRAADLASMA